MHNILDSDNYNLLHKISEYVWDQVCQQRQNNIPPEEDGITKNLISAIKNNVAKYPTLGLYSNLGFKESENGSDIDFFIKIMNDNYIWIALQAKALKVDLTYGNISKKSGSLKNYQWEKLDNLSKNSDCLPSYLLYNGLDQNEFKYKGIDSYSNVFNEKQFGCSIIDLEFVKANHKKCNFFTFHPDNAEPWTSLIYNKMKYSTLRTYSYDQIQKRVELYEQILGSTDQFIGNEYQFLNISNDLKNISDKVGWNPSYTIIIN